MNSPLADALAEYRQRIAPTTSPDPRRRVRVALAVALALLVLAGGAWAALRPTGPTPATESTAAYGLAGLEHLATVRSQSEQPSQDAPTRAADPTVVLSVAPATVWREWAGPVLSSSLPASDSAGPREADPNRLAGFAHTPTGALFAAASLHPAVYYTRDRAAWDWLATERVLWPGDAREQLAAQLEPVWAVTGTDVALSPVGFRMLTYTLERAEVRLWWQLTRPHAESVIVGAIVSVQWAARDWRLWFNEGSMDMRQLDPARDSYIAWRPT